MLFFFISKHGIIFQVIKTVISGPQVFSHLGFLHYAHADLKRWCSRLTVLKIY